jgi:hypothetical protein
MFVWHAHCVFKRDIKVIQLHCKYHTSFSISKDSLKKIRVITRLPNSEQSYKGKVKTNKYNVQAIYSFYHNTVRPVIREACYSHLENTCMAASYSHVLFECVYEPRKVSVHVYVWIRVITKLPNSEQSSKGKIKTHKYINRHNQSTTGKLWKP